MSSTLIAAKNSVLGGALIGKNSLFAARGFTATTPVHADYTARIVQTNGVTTPNLALAAGASAEVVFALPKSSTLVSDCVVETVLSAGTEAGGAIVEYIKNFGDEICKAVTLQYGNTQLQRYDSEFQVFFRRLCKNDVNIEHINTTVFGNLPPSTNPAGTEAVLRSAYLNGCTVLTPLEELFFVHAKDEAWMPESLALEGQLRIQLASLSDLLITSTGLAAAIGTQPAITSCQLRYLEFTLSAAEKENRLKLYKTPEGSVCKFMDLETQLGTQFTGLNAARPAYALGASNLAAQALVDIPAIQMGNVRMDMAEIMFVVRRQANTNAANYPDEAGVIGTAFQGSKFESNGSNSLVTGAPISTMIQIDSFSVEANGKTIFSSQPDLLNRTYIRKYYHPDSQVADPVYCVPLALFPEDRRNATGHLSASVLGNLTLNIRVRDPGNAITYQVDVWVHSHNIIQSRAGGITKALH